MTDVQTTEELSFRQKVLHNEFNAIKIGELVWITIMPKFVTMYPLCQQYMEGRCIEIIDNGPSPDFHPSFDRKVVVTTELGQWTFMRDGRSLNKICSLSVSRVYGQLLCLYEPEFVDRPPPTDLRIDSHGSLRAHDTDEES